MEIKNLKSKLNSKETKHNIFRAIMLMISIVNSCPMVFANDNYGSTAILAVLSVVFLIMNVHGIIFLIIGFVKLIIAHAQEDAPGQQKAAMFIATGIVLLVARVVMAAMEMNEWIELPS